MARRYCVPPTNACKRDVAKRQNIAAGRKTLDAKAFAHSRRGLVLGIVAFCLPGVAFVVAAVIAAAVLGGTAG
jgi:hypothetical protein